jgi:four helix bundle protein
MKIANATNQQRPSTHAKPFDLEERTLLFAKRSRAFVKKLPKTIANIEDGKQLIRSTGSVGANYIEAREALSSKDHVHRLRISRKESKESAYWYQLVDIGNGDSLMQECQELLQEARELMYIFNAMIENQERKQK